jgi:hypothetical protein
LIFSKNPRGADAWLVPPAGGHVKARSQILQVISSLEVFMVTNLNAFIYRMHTSCAAHLI